MSDWPGRRYWRGSLEKHGVPRSISPWVNFVPRMGGSTVLQALDDHYRYLPETELNECLDEFLFHLKKKPGEGPTAFVSRFKAVLARLETLIAADKAVQKGTKRRRPLKGPKQPDSETSDISGSPPEEPGLTEEKVKAAAAEAETSASASVDPKDADKSTKGPRTVGSFVGSPSARKKGPSSKDSRGTQKGDDERANRNMLERLELLEVGHLKLKPVFPAVVLGHLFMRKYGLSREQRSQVIRSTGGSSRFADIEKVIRASDFEVPVFESGHRSQPSRPHRREVLAADESSVEEPTDSDDDEINEADEESDDEELEEAYEIHKKAKQSAKRAVRSYKESRRRVREIKKDRQPYMPVVAIAPGGQPPVDNLPVQPTFKYDKKDGKKGGKGNRRGSKEEAHLFVETSCRSSPTWCRRTRLRLRSKSWRWTFPPAWPSLTPAALLQSSARTRLFSTLSSRTS